MDLTKIDLSNLNINAYLSTLKECLKASNQFGADVYYNICTGTHTLVPWGGMDWTLAVFGLTAATVGTLLVAAFAAGFTALAISEF